MLSVVVGGQAGSEGKGAVTARLVRRSTSTGQTVHAVRVAGHNAGHTAYDGDGRKWAVRTVPAAAVDPDAILWIGAGSELQLEVLAAEVNAFEEAGIAVRDRLYIDSSATVIEDRHFEAETGMHEKMGSTGKGVGAARADRIMRTAKTVADYREQFERYGMVVNNTGPTLRDLAGAHDHVIIEGTQGYQLGVHTASYPFTTSSDCRAIDFLAMAGIDPGATPGGYDVWAVLRRYPIRVAGNSGPLEDEVSWERLGLEPEKTTVTQKTRRVGEWNDAWAREAVDANGGRHLVRVALTMADQAHPEIAGWDGAFPVHRLPAELISFLDRIETVTGVRPELVGTSPTTMMEL